MEEIAGLEVAKAASPPPFPEAWGAVNHSATPLVVELEEEVEVCQAEMDK